MLTQINRSGDANNKSFSVHKSGITGFSERTGSVDRKLISSVASDTGAVLEQMLVTR